MRDTAPTTFISIATTEEQVVREIKQTKMKAHYKRSDAAKARLLAKAKDKITLPKFSWDK